MGRRAAYSLGNPLSCAISTHDAAPFGFFKHYGPSELGITQKNIALEGYIWKVLGAAVTAIVAF